MTPSLSALLLSFLLYCDVNLPQCKITSIVSDAPNRVHLTHFSGRAFDVSVKYWSKEQIENTIKFFTKHYNTMGAYSASDYKQRVVIYHKVKGGQYHLHFQTRD